ncbi:hypothetical protein PNA2_1517 [Pyrococcus sp. NA2]|uniref:YfdX family protein n=1 Tax=Pyrococcus sp. (strain NA2) TaxID=342949 RepID=UPI000209B01F|nr:hypothetical protein PNA2_1517 [Pyrococcus sp. NA2]
MRKLGISVILIVLMSSVSFAYYNGSSLVKILANSIEVCKILGYGELEGNLENTRDKVQELIREGELTSAFAIMNTTNYNVISKLMEENVNVPENFEIEGKIDRLKFYISLLNKTNAEPIVELIKKAEENLKQGNLKEAEKYINSAEAKLPLYVQTPPSVTTKTKLNLLLSSYKGTMKYALQVSVALNYSEYANIENEIAKIEDIIKRAEELIKEGREIEAFLLLEENLDFVISFQRKLDEYHKKIITRLFKENNRLLILKLSLVAKQYENSEFKELVKIAISDLNLAKEDIKLKRYETAYLRILRASKILDYIIREEGS